MRGTDEASESLFSYVDLEERIPAGHPLHKIRQIVNDALTSLDAEFDALYTDFGRPSIAPERLIRASLLQILFSIRSERQLMEQMDYNLLFRWFVGLGIDDPVWVPTVFSKNRDRLLTTDMSRKVMAAILAHPQPGLFIQIDGGRLRAPESAVESSCYTKIRQQLRTHAWVKRYGRSRPDSTALFRSKLAPSA